MIRLLVALFVMVAAVWLAKYALHDDASYVVIGFGSWYLKSSLTVFVVLLMVVLVPMYFLVRIALALWRSPRSMKAWRRGRRYKDAQEALSDGLMALAEGRWREAENQLIHSVKQGANPQLGYIAAARAAQSLGASGRRDDYLRVASDVNPSVSVAVGLTQAQMQLNESQREHALATLLQLHSESPRHAHVIELLSQLYADLEDWQRLLDLVPALRMQKVVSKRQGDALEVKAHLGILMDSAVDAGVNLQTRWDAMPKSMRENVELLGAYVEICLERGERQTSERLLYASINRRWDDRLVYLYGRVAGEDSKRQLNVAEKWLTGREENALLLLSLGRLCIRNRLWGKARSYLDVSIGLDPSIESYQTLTKLLEEIGETEEAAQQARNALALTQSRLVFLPSSARERFCSYESKLVSTAPERALAPPGESSASAGEPPNPES